MKITASIVALMSLVGVASAQADEKKPAAGAPAKPQPPAMQMPKPAPELDQMKVMIGTWKCDGKMSMNGNSMPSSATYTVAPDLDGFWIVGKLEGAKTKEMPMVYKGLDYYNYDPGSKMFVMMSVDNMGMWAMSKSKGWEGDKQVWNGKTTMMGHEMDTTMTVTKKSDKETLLSGSTTAPGFTQTMEMTCKKK